MTGLLEGKIALVTGAASGIGRATALVMSREGATVVVSDVNADGGEETVSAIKERGGEGMFVHADVSRAGDAAALIEQVVSAYGRAGLRPQQRRRRGLHGRASPPIPGRPVGPAHKHQPQGRVALHEVRNTANAGAGRRGHSQHRVNCGAGRLEADVGLFGQQARGDRADQDRRRWNTPGTASG